MGPVVADWDSDGEGPLQQTQNAIAGNGLSKRRDSVSDSPCVNFSSCQKHMKEEDVLFVQEELTWVEDGPAWSLYCIFDSHTGVAAAQYVRNNLWETLGPMLPTDPAPSHKSAGFKNFTLDIRTAVVKAFMSLDQQFRIDMPSSASGTTVTMVLLCGRLLTVANVGDSDAVLDTGTEHFMLTVNHRIDDNATERERLSKAGVHLAALSACLTRPAGLGEKGLGPLRCWPGGLAFSRSVGDISAGGHVFSCPHVFQVVVPKSGARVVMGSDGLWDLVDWEDAVKIVRWTPIRKAASRIMTQALFQNDWSFTDDTTALVVDILPPGCEDFTVQVRQKLKREQNEKKEKNCRWDLRNCFCGTPRNLGESEEDRDCDRVTIVASIDGWELLKQALRASPNDSCSSLMELTCGLFDEFGNVAELEGEKACCYSVTNKPSFDRMSPRDDWRSSDCRSSQASKCSGERRLSGSHKLSHSHRCSGERLSIEEPRSARSSSDCRRLQGRRGEARHSADRKASSEFRSSIERLRSAEGKAPVPSPRRPTRKQGTPAVPRVSFTMATTEDETKPSKDGARRSEAPTHSKEAVSIAQAVQAARGLPERRQLYSRQQYDQAQSRNQEVGMHSLSLASWAQYDGGDDVSLEAWGAGSA